MKSLIPFLLLNFVFSATCFGQDLLKQCRNKQVNPLLKKTVQLSYREKANRLYHSAEPWQLLSYGGEGMVWVNSGYFAKQDTLKRGKRTFFSRTQYNGSELLFLDHGDTSLSSVTKRMFAERCFLSARYVPTHLIGLAARQKFLLSKEQFPEFAVYEGTVNKMPVKLYIRRSDSLLAKAEVVRADDYYGDVTQVFSYSEYAKADNFFYPRHVRLTQHAGKVTEDVEVIRAKLVDKAPTVLEKPTDYTMNPEDVDKLVTTVEKYSSHLHFINLMDASSRVLLVEFDKFLLVAEAPLSSGNGERIIREARKKAPGKPITYFVAGHHHPHYTGGMRAFVHKGAKVITVGQNQEFFKYLIDAPHRLQPDSLQMQPRPLQIELIKDSLQIESGGYKMIIYFLGEKSGHTKDYLVYYFPQEKMLFEDDLVWIASKGEPNKAPERQISVYNLIKEKHLDVRTIVQSWGIASPEYKNIISFEELEASMSVK